MSTILSLFGTMMPNKNKKLEKNYQSNASTCYSRICDQMVIDYNIEFTTHKVKKVSVINSVTSVYNNLDEVDMSTVLMCKYSVVERH